MNEDSTNIKVAVRCRPLNNREKAMGDMKCVNMSSNQLTITSSASKEEHFAFDVVLGEDSTQEQVWQSIGVPIMDKAFAGYNGTIFAYGQTGSGKSWTMLGQEGELQGVIPRMNAALFDRISDEVSRNSNLQFLVTASYFELYNEVIFDLLDPVDRRKKPANQRGGLEIKEHNILGVYVKGLQEIVVDSAAKLMSLLDQGAASRTTSSTNMNEDSSRSHSIFTIKIHQKDAADDSKNLFAKINLVDLAGSERAKSTGASGSALKEGANINKSLSALGNVINALVEQAKGKKGVFIPYRNSKLTRVLQESLGGNSITVMIAAMSPALCNFEETLSTLKYANRAKDIKVRAVKNDESSQISRLNEEIRMLKEKLLAGGSIQTENSDAKHQQQLKELEEAMRTTWEDKARISEQHEKERLKLLAEQEAASLQLSQQIESTWKLLQSKADLELTLSHVRELAARDNTTTLEYINQWINALKELQHLESALSEQETIVLVYRNSLLSDCKHSSDTSIGRIHSHQISPRKKNQSTADKHNVTAGSLKQVSDKLHSMQHEMSKWSVMKEDILRKTDAVLGNVKKAISTTQMKIRNDSDVITSSATPKNESQFLRGLHLIESQLESKYDSVPPSLNAAIGDLSPVTSFLIQLLREQSVSLDAVEYDGESLLSRSGDALLKDIANSLQSVQSLTGTAVSQPEIIDLSNYYCISSTMFDKFRPDINSATVWELCPQSALNVEFSTPVSVSHVLIQPSHVKSTHINGLNDGNCSSRNLICDGDWRTTASMIAEVLSWESLIKSTPPEKFLKRPPVRFLFDLFQALLPQLQTCDSHLVNDVTTLLNCRWEEISVSKESKVLFMDRVIDIVARGLNAEPATTGHNIVTGSEAELTNNLLQQMVQLILKCRVSSPVPPTPPANTSRGIAGASHSIFLEIFTDSDTKPFSTMTVAADALTMDAIATIQMNDIHSSSRVSKVRLRVEDNGTGNNSLAGALRLGFRGYNTTNLTQQPCDKISEDAGQTLGVLQSCVSVILKSLSHLDRVEEQRMQAQQEEFKKMMDGLTNEKNRLEETLATEKQALATEKQDLADQLTSALIRLKEVETMLVQEKSLRLAAETLRISLEQEKNEIQLILRDANEEISEINNEKLKLEVSAERDKKMLEALLKRKDDDEIAIATLTNEVSVLKQKQSEWEAEKDDLSTQIFVLTEERDEARRMEEELYDQLREKTDDLDRLQESYVVMTDRCNDLQDEFSDLREKFENLQSTVSEHTELLAARHEATATPMCTISNSYLSGHNTSVTPLMQVQRSADDIVLHQPTAEDHDYGAFGDTSCQSVELPVSSAYNSGATVGSLDMEVELETCNNAACDDEYENDYEDEFED